MGSVCSVTSVLHQPSQSQTGASALTKLRKEGKQAVLRSCPCPRQPAGSGPGSVLARFSGSSQGWMWGHPTGRAPPPQPAAESISHGSTENPLQHHLRQRQTQRWRGTDTHNSTGTRWTRWFLRSYFTWWEPQDGGGRGPGLRTVGVEVQQCAPETCVFLCCLKEEAAEFRRLAAILRHCLMVHTDGDEGWQEFHR